MKSLPDNSVDAVITDPPYGTTACKWDSVIPFEPMWKELKRIAKPKAAIVLFASQPFTSALVMSNPRMFRFEWVWDKKRCTGGSNTAYYPMKAHETVLVFGRETPMYRPQMGSWDGITLTRRKNIVQVAKGDHQFATHVNLGADERRKRGRFPDSVLRIPALGSNHPERTGHPTQKPVDLLRYLVRTYTHEGETVLDFTMGSGSTGVACALENRRFIGIEKDAGYFEIDKQRISEATAKEPLFA
jgi:site-specific DNA-methyltransferase (adenine-specific)